MCGWRALSITLGIMTIRIIRVIKVIRVIRIVWISRVGSLEQLVHLDNASPRPQ